MIGAFWGKIYLHILHPDGSWLTPWYIFYAYMCPKSLQIYKKHLKFKKNEQKLHFFVKMFPYMETFL